MKLHSRRCIEETLSGIKVSPRICCCADVNVCPRFPTEPKQIPSSCPKLTPPTISPPCSYYSGADAAWWWGTDKMRWFAEELRKLWGIFCSVWVCFHQPKSTGSLMNAIKRWVDFWVVFRDAENMKSWGALRMKTRMRSRSGLACFSRWQTQESIFFSPVFRSAETLFQTLPQTK